MSSLDPADELAIGRLVHDYADAVVRRDADQWLACWADDASWDLGRGRDVSGRAAIGELWRSAMDGFEAVVQMVHNGAVALGGTSDEATGRWYIDERYRRADGTNGILLAHYDDQYVRVGGAWRFRRRALVVHYGGPPDLTAAFATR